MEDKSESSNDRRFVRRIKRRKEEWRCGRSGGEAISRKRDEREEMEKRLKKKNRGVVKATTRGADEELEGDSVASPLASVLPSVAVRLISRVVCIRAKCGFFKPQFRLCATCHFGKVRPGKHVTSVLSLGSYPSPHWPSDNAHLLWSCLSEFQVWCCPESLRCPLSASGIVDTNNSGFHSTKYAMSWMHTPPPLRLGLSAGQVTLNGRCGTDIVMLIVMTPARFL